MFAFQPLQGGTYQIELDVAFSGGRVGSAVDSPILVQGIAPSLTSLAVASPTGLIFEGAPVTIRAQATDVRERVGLNYRWGLKKPGETVFTTLDGVDGAPADFRFTPTDNNVPGVHGNYEVQVSITDSQGLETVNTLVVDVRNAVPLLSIDASVDATDTTKMNFVAIASDPGTADDPDLKYEWNINDEQVNNNLVFTALSSSNAISTTLSQLNKLTVRITDGDGGVTLQSYLVRRGTEGDDTVVLNANNTTGGAVNDQILYLGLNGSDNITIANSVQRRVVVIAGDGNDIVDASAASVPVELDGGEGDDVLTGGASDDVLIAGPGMNVLNGGQGNNRFVGGGSDTMIDGHGNSIFQVHFSTVVLLDAGGTDTIDLTAAQAGVTLNLSNNTGQAQSVFISSIAPTIEQPPEYANSTLSLEGSFEKLIGSTFDDNFITTTQGTEIDGGLGNDTITSGALDVNMRGGDGADTLIFDGGSGTIDGGEGNDEVRGRIAGATISSIATGAGDDTIDIEGLLLGEGQQFAFASVSLGSGNNVLSARRIRGKIYGSNGSSGLTEAFGSATPSVSTLSVSDSNNVDIFGTATPNGSALNVTVSGSSNIDIFGSASPNGSVLTATVNGSNEVDIFGSASKGISTATVNDSQNVEIFGTASPNGSRLGVTVTGSSNIDIFGSAALGASTVSVSDSNNVDIFGSASPVSSDLSVTVSGSSNIDIFGTASPNGGVLTALIVGGSNEVDIFGSASSGVTTVTVNDSQNIDIFGTASPNGSRLSATVNSSSNIDIFGSASAGVTTVSVNDSNHVDIFGTASPNGSALTATVNSSSNIDIFGSASASVTTLTVNDSHHVDIFGTALPNGSALNATVSGSSNIDIFGSASATVTNVTVNDSQHVDIFGTASPTGSSLNATVTSSSNIDIFGSASNTATTISVDGSHDIEIFGSASPNGSRLIATVNDSSNIEIFGSASFGSTLNVNSSNEIDIYGGYGDKVNLADVQRARIEGGVFGTASLGGIHVTVSESSANVGIFGTSLQDTVELGESSQVGVDMRGGDDIVDVDGAEHLVAITDDGLDRVKVRSGLDILIYLGAADDRVEILGGELIRLIGESGSDEIMMTGGSNLTFDGGDSSDTVFVTGGSGINLRGDAGDDVVDIYGGIGLSVGGGVGDDHLSVYGSLGSILGPGQAYALLDGQDGDDALAARPLFSATQGNGLNAINFTAPYRTLPGWMTIPSWITAPQVTKLPSSVALVGGPGNNELWLEGGYRLYGIGGDESDSITLQAGAGSEISGGRGNDTITIQSASEDNRIFGDQGDDTIIAFAGKRLALFGEQGLDQIQFYGGQDGFARGGDEVDNIDIYAGTRLTVVGELGNDQLTIRGGIDAVAAGGVGDDLMEIIDGTNGIALGQTGNDHMVASGGTRSILSGGDGDDFIEASSRGNDLYGDDGDDTYKLLSTSTPGLTERIRELLYVDPNDFEPEARGSDTIDLSSFHAPAVLDLGNVGVFTSSTLGLQNVIAEQLQLILLGSLENIIGTFANDFLTGTIESNRLDGRGGNDVLRGVGGDDTLVGGTGDDSLEGGVGDDLYLFETSIEIPLGSDMVVEANGGGNDGLDFSGMPIGLGTLDLDLATTQNLGDGLLSLSLRQSSGNLEVGEMEEVVGTRYSDTILGNALDNRIEGKAGNDTLDGRSGSDIYVFTGRNLGADQVIDAPLGAGRDTLDFVGLDAPLHLDLSVTTPQNLGEVTLTLGSDSSVENVLGTSFDDTIYGNTRDNAIFGAAGSDYLHGRSGDDRLVAGLSAVVLLDFDSAYRADRGDYNYSTQERAAIELRLKETYGPFEWLFTQSEQTARSLSADLGRNFVRLAFSQGRGGGVSGDAGEVDFRNIQRRLISEVNINPLLPSIREIVAQRLGANFTAQQHADEFSATVVAMTSTIAGHELAHTAGLRHGDAFGPIGSGMFEGTDPSQIYPEDLRPGNAFETGRHLMASPASVGTSLEDASLTTFLGEREAIKMAFNEIGRTRRELGSAAFAHASPGTAEDLGTLASLYVPNLAPVGFTQSGKNFKVSALAVIGDLVAHSTSGETERDYYKFTGQAGDIVNIELLVNSIRPLRGDAFDGELRIYRPDGTLWMLNDDDFEGTKDATLLDLVLPVDGQYTFSVGMSEFPAIESQGGRYELFLSRFAHGNSLPVEGDTLVGGAGRDNLVGGAADDVVSAVDSVFGDLADDVFGGPGVDTLDLAGLNTAYTANDIIENIINPYVPFTIAAPSNAAVGQTVELQINGKGLPVGAQYSIQWGDGFVQTIAANNAVVNAGYAYLTTSSTSGFAINVTARSSTGTVLATQSRSIVVTSSLVVDEAGQLVLYGGGTANADTMNVRMISATTFGLKLSATGSEVVYNYGNGVSPIRRIVLYGLGGNDTITVAASLPVPAELYGGLGNDSLRGGGGDDILAGGAGNDTLYGFAGRDLLIGGNDRDSLYSLGDGDILISGRTAYDENRVALGVISAYWSNPFNGVSLVEYQTRVNTLRTVGVQSYVFNSLTTFDDNALDTLSGENNTGGNPNRKLNWYIYNTLGSGIKDSLQRKVLNEISTDIGGS